MGKRLKNILRDVENTVHDVDIINREIVKTNVELGENVAQVSSSLP